MAATAVPLLPFDVWPAGIEQAATPANNNAMRSQVLASGVVSIANTEPGSPSDYDLYIIGTTWAGYPDEAVGTLAYFLDGTWYFWLPFEGLLKNVGGTLYEYTSGAWAVVTLPTAAAVSTVSGTSRNLLAADGGNYLRFTNSSAKTLTVQDEADEAIPQGFEVHGRNANTGDLTIVEDTAVTINPPAGGTLVVPEGGTFTLKKVGTDEWDLFGVTVAA